MKLFVLMHVLALLLGSQNVRLQGDRSIPFEGKSYVVLDASSGQVLEEKNKDYVQSVASISKIMTCIIAIENKDLNTIVEVDDTINKAWGSGVYVHIGDRISLRDLVYGLMLRSGNDAAVLIAKAVSGSIEAFVQKMNDKALEIGLENTHFSNPTGLDEEDSGNRSSAYDMARILAYCHQNPIFDTISQTKLYRRQDGNGTWKNKNRLLHEYPYCIGGKTGFTKKAKRTLATIASKDGMDFIIVTLQCGNDFSFHKSTYEKYFSLLKYVTLHKGVITYKNKKYFLDLDIDVPTLQKSAVTYQIIDDTLVIKIGNAIYATEKVDHAYFLRAIIRVCEDLLYG